MKRISMFFGKLALERLQAIHKTTGISVSEQVRRAVDEYLAKQK